MDDYQLPNYLVANRKRLGLSQADVAYLISVGTGEQVCRHERFLREPNLRTALAYEAIYKRTVSELFSGLYRNIEEEIAVQAASLMAKIRERKPYRENARKRSVLEDIAGV